MPKNTQKRKKEPQPQPVSALGALLGRFWGAPGRPKRSLERRNASPKPFFSNFFAICFSLAFCIDFCSAKFRNDLYRNLENRAPIDAKRYFSQNRFFRLATKFYGNMTTKTHRFESPNRNNSEHFAKKTRKKRSKAM